MSFGKLRHRIPRSMGHRNAIETAFKTQGFSSLRNLSAPTITVQKAGQSTMEGPNNTAELASSKISASFAKRFKVMAEVTVSKVFPAGFGWQAGSVVAGDMGYGASDLSFALMTGFGDFTGVFLGHSLLTAFKVATGKNADGQISTGFMLASAAFCSGTAWQPIVNTLQAANYSFAGVAGITTVACCAAFFTGLRLTRMVYPSLGLKVEPASYSNLKKDASLSLAIGAAGGGFVGTDALYHPDENFLKDVVGVLPYDSTLVACSKAGTATSIGFVAVQTAQNVSYHQNKNWTD